QGAPRIASRTARSVGLRFAITAGIFAVVVASAARARADDAATSATRAPPAPSREPAAAPEDAWFSPTPTYVHDDVPTRSVDAGARRACDDDDPRARFDPRCDDVAPRAPRR